jgi:hypothetical protein
MPLCGKQQRKEPDTGVCKKRGNLREDRKSGSSTLMVEDDKVL